LEKQSKLQNPPSDFRPLPTRFPLTNTLRQYGQMLRSHSIFKCAASEISIPILPSGGESVTDSDIPGYRGASSLQQHDVYRAIAMVCNDEMNATPMWFSIFRAGVSVRVWTQA
jgi:hypothetical protein